MPRMKRTARKQPMEDVVYEEPPRDHPLGKYFKTLDDPNGYMVTFSDRKEIPPRYLEISLIGSQNFNTLAKFLDDQVLMPRAHGHGHVTDDDLVIMYAMVNEITINWTYFIVQHMLRFTKSQSSTSFGYDCLWSRIFNHFRIDLSEEVSKTLGNSGVIDIRTLHHMGRAMEEEEAPQAHQAPQAPLASHEAQAGPSQQPSMLDLMHVVQRIDQNQDRMDRQFQRVDRRLHRIEQYLETEEDEYEDQD
ncbi:hypothetical protein PIB30_104319 [Stylosanthes scabra]|uniref:Uncharacterized protein n=1 Tax=Stylosanthes scabra TaxID=79078 RepID=A0ABU6QXP2_9FABA|nr:hypothetical protein [Stylosanthes scabra]